MKNLLYRFAKWLLGYTTPTGLVVVEFAKTDIYDAAVDVCRSVNTLNAGSEFKRHQALAKMKDRFPGVRERELAYAIELAVRSVLP